MPITLKSFDNDAMSGKYKKGTYENFSRTQPNESIHNATILTPERKGYTNKRAIFNDQGDNDDGIEFDDTRIETPKLLRRDKSFNSSEIPSGYRSSFTTRQPQDPFVTTTKVPLKNDGPSENRRPSTPKIAVVDKINKYKSRNGTPLRNSPIVSSDHRDFSFDNGNHHDEADIIRNLRIIADDNTFQPNNIPANNGRVKRSKRSDDDVTMSPPSSLKMKPWKFQKDAKHDRSNKLNDDIIEADHTSGEIEFDSSDEDDNEEGKKDSYKVFEKKIQDSSHFDRVTTPTLSMRNNDNASPSDSYKKDHSILYRSADRGDEGDAQENALDKLSDIWGGMTSEKVLDQINSSFSYLKEQDTKLNQSEHIPQINFDNEIDINSDEGSADDSDPEILQELDSHLPRSELPTSDHHRSEIYKSERNYNAHSYNTGVHRIPISKVSSPIKVIEDTTNPSLPTRPKYSQLSGRYARQVMKEKRESIQNHELSSNAVPVQRADDYDYDYVAWPRSRWVKLRNLLALEKLTENIIVNSDLVLNSFECSSKQELKERIKYLKEYERHKFHSRKITTPKQMKKSVGKKKL